MLGAPLECLVYADKFGRQATRAAYPKWHALMVVGVAPMAGSALRSDHHSPAPEGKGTDEPA